MEELFNSTFNKVKMDVSYKDKLRNRLYELEVDEQPGFSDIGKLRKKGNRRFEGSYIGRAAFAGKLAAAAAFILAVLMCIPVTRGEIMNAAEYVKTLFHTSNGSEVIVEHGKDAEKEGYSMTVDIDEDNGYLEVEGGRMSFVLDDIKEDVTDQCDAGKWFRYENMMEDGGRSVILIGGTPENCGWAELIFDESDNYITNLMSCPPDSQWLTPAMAAEGVPTGDPQYDQKFLEE